MRTRFPLVGGVLAALVLVPFAACGEKSPAGGPTIESVDSDLSSLVPSDAMVFAHTPSLDALTAKVRGLIATVDPVRAAGIDVRIQFAGASALDHLDTTRPAAFALAPAVGEDPVATYVVPTKDPVAFSRAVGADADGPVVTATKGRYVAVTMGAAPAARGGGLGARAPEGDLGLRVDLARVAQELDRSVGSDTPPDAGRLSGAVRSFLASAESLDVGVTIDGAHVDLIAELRAREGSPLATSALVPSDRLAELAGHLPRDFPFTVLASMDATSAAANLEARLEAWLAEAPADAKQVFDSFARGIREAARHLGNEHSFGLGVGGQGLEMVGISAAKDAKAFLAQSQSVVGATLASVGEAIPFETLPPATVAGIEVTGFRIGMPMPTVDEATGESSGASLAGLLLGAEGFVYRAAAVEGRVVWTIGGGQSLIEQAIGSAKKSAGVPATLRPPIHKAGGKLSFLLAVDGRALGSQIFTLLRARLPRSETARFRSIPAGRPATLTVYVTVDGRSYRGGASIDAGAWIETARPLLETFAR
jgi:hypothetical protein